MIDNIIAGSGVVGHQSEVFRANFNRKHSISGCRRLFQESSMLSLSVI
jgi:hypothetical protein